MRNVRREDWESLKPTIYGWGVVDVNYNVYSRKIVGGKVISFRSCGYYTDWQSILTRCLSEKCHNRQPTYSNCTVCESWKYLSNFIKWVDSQPNNDWINCIPDKDLLYRGNKHYSATTVVYVNQELNKFVTDSARARGTHMIGVTHQPQGSKINPYVSRCANPFIKNNTNLGRFKTELEAHKAWQAKKHECACKFADLQEDPRVAEALRQRYAPDKDWTKG
jgi:hypothetical protein